MSSALMRARALQRPLLRSNRMTLERSDKATRTTAPHPIREPCSGRSPAVTQPPPLTWGMPHPRRPLYTTTFPRGTSHSSDQNNLTNSIAPTLLLTLDHPHPYGSSTNGSHR